MLPGVTVEAASPALIEKTRTAVSDGTGQYRIEDLRPGTYTVNAMNSAAILAYNNTFSTTVTSGASAWLSPTSVLTGRMIRISGEFSF